MNQNQIVSILEKGGVVPVVRLPSLEQAAPLVRALLAGGITAIEPTMTSPGALDVLPTLLAEIAAFGAGEAVLGMGSVTSPEQAAAAIDAGARFIVSPALDLPTVAYCVERGVPVMPGALTLGNSDGLESRRVGGEGLSGAGLRPQLFQRCAGSPAPSASDAHRRRGPLQRGRFCAGGCGGRRRGQRPGGQETD